MLDAALDLLAEQGVTVSLDGLQLEEVIRRADVARTSAYRRWPTRDAFVEDVLLALAEGAELTEVGGHVAELAGDLLADPATDLTTPEGRHDVFVELVRLTFQSDLEATLGSPQFRTYLALRTAFVGVASAELRTRLAAALARSERRGAARAAAILRGACELFGLRLVGPLGAVPDGPQAVARALAATTSGFLVAALADPDLVHTTRTLAPFGSTRPAPWSVPALTLAGIVLAEVEVDPDVTPDPARIAAHVPGLVDVGAAAAARAE